ncbi:MAG: DUF4340 domain-containing protein [Oscillospiraceae bacterium]|nr:DUF4340 domain-containing protein [Oscillospiraceae bacterium]
MSSKKMKGLILILVVLLVLAIGGYLIADAIISAREKKEAEELASMTLFSFDPLTIDEVTLDTKQGFFRFNVQDSVWAIAETDYKNPITLNPSYISTICSYMGGLTASTKFNADLEKLENYGLADPVVLTCSAGNKDYTLHVGNATPTQEYFYVMVPGNDTVYGIEYEQGVILYGDPQALKTPYMINDTEVDLVEVSLERDGKLVFDMVTKDNHWKMAAPLPNANIVSSEVNSMLTSLTRLMFESYVGVVGDSCKPADYGLSKPYATLTVKNVKGEKTVIDFAKPDPNNGVTHVLLHNTNEIAAMETGHLNFLSVEISEFIEPRLLYLPMNEVKALDVSVDDITFRMELDAETGMQKFNGTDISTLEENAAATFKLLYESVAYLEFDTLDVDAQVDVTAEPAAVFRYTKADGTETQLSLIAIDDTSYYAVIDGEYTHMTVRRRSLSGNTGVLNFYERMMDMSAAE